MKDFLSTFPERCIDHIRFAVIGKLVVKELVEHFKGASCIYVASLFLPIVSSAADTPRRGLNMLTWL